ncbi:MAG: radical SAM protein, partial [Candidatus Aureabacteria bacterium]|nr:radical SAM protein [Candidatus Auribacterota bacterium]
PLSASGGADHELIQKGRPAEVVGFYGGLTSTIPRILDLARFYKSGGAITVAGGQHCVDETIPEALSSDIDIIALGEGEEIIQELLRAFTRGDDLSAVAGLAYREDGAILRTPARPPIQDLDALPLPDFSLLRYARVTFFPVGRVRGCKMACEFCTVKDTPRCASAERLVEQVARIVETMGGKEFFIVDDFFGQDRDETLRLCSLLKNYQEQIGRRLRFTVQIRLDTARDTELLTAMRNAGINVVAIGFESPIPEELKAMNKGLRPAEMVELSRLFHHFGFFVHGMFIFGYPMKEGFAYAMPIEERVAHYRRFIKEARIDTIQVLLPVPLPGTALRERLARRNRIYSRKDLGWEYYDAGFPLFEPDPPLTAEEMQRAVRRIMGRYYNVRCLVMFLLTIFSMPYLLFYVFSIKSGWRRWYRRWRNYFFRFIGSRIIRRWTFQLHKGRFLDRLKQAQRNIATRVRDTYGPIDA